jgi:hypothetical protein
MNYLTEIERMLEELTEKNFLRLEAEKTPDVLKCTIISLYPWSHRDQVTLTIHYNDGKTLVEMFLKEEMIIDTYDFEDVAALLELFIKSTQSEGTYDSLS